MSERLIELERAEAKREALEEAIKKIESLETTYRSDTYRKAWKAAVSSIRTLMLGVK